MSKKAFTAFCTTYRVLDTLFVMKYRQNYAVVVYRLRGVKNLSPEICFKLNYSGKWVNVHLPPNKLTL